MENLERQELFCHNCEKYVQFDLDININGDHEIECPSCGHIHYRVIKDGIITDRRWGSSNRLLNANTSFVVTTASHITYTSTSTFDNYITSSNNSTLLNYTITSTCDSTSDSDTDIFLYGSWLNTTPIS